MTADSMILFEDRDILVCHKPEGIPVQSAKLGQKDMVSILNNYLAEKHDRDAGGAAETVSVVHRLDQPVEGVIVFARTKRAAAGLSRQIADGSMEKVYRAVCRVTEQAKERYVRPDEAENADPQVYQLTDYLIKNGRTNTSSVGKKGQKDAKEARLSFRILDRREEELLTEIRLETGRHHQIRVQMANAGLPLIGDLKYNPSAEKGDPQVALCAVSLTFRHPVTGKRLNFKIEPEKKAFVKFG